MNGAAEQPKFVGGPLAGETFRGPKRVAMLVVPLDSHLDPMKERAEPFAFAMYKLVKSKAGEVYQFLGAQRREHEKLFEIEFIDGPMKGMQHFRQAIHLFDIVFAIPLGTGNQPLSEGWDVQAIAEYRRRKVGEDWKMALERIVGAGIETEQYSDMLAENRRIDQLGAYTSEQLIKALMSRQSFLGVIVMVHGETGLGDPIEKEHTLRFLCSPSLDPAGAKIFLQGALTALEKK